MDSLTRQISVLTKGVFKELRESREAMASRLSGIQVEIRSVRDQQEARAGPGRRTRR